MPRLTPEFLVEDIALTAAWYQENLKFEIVVLAPDTITPSFVRMKRGDAEIMFYRRAEFSQEIPNFVETPLGGSTALYLEVEEINQEWQNFENSAFVINALHQTEYETKEFIIKDCNGYYLIIGEKS